MPLFTPSETHAFQKFLSSLDNTDFSPPWNMQLELSHDHIPQSNGKDALAQATKDLISLDADKWRYSLPHHQSPPPTRLSPSAPPVIRHPRPQSNSLSFLYSTRREKRIEGHNATPPHLLPPLSRSRVHIPPLPPTVDPSSISTRTRTRTFAFHNTSSSSSSQSPIDPSSSCSSSSHDTTPTPVSSTKRSPPPDPNVSNKRRRQSTADFVNVATRAQSSRAVALLSPSQKKANHIQSEQKRRANIRRGYEALCDTVPALREAMMSEPLEEDEGCANANANAKIGKKRCKGRATNDDGDKIDGRAGPKSEHVVLSKTIDYINELLSDHDVLKQRLMVARNTLPLDHPLLQRYPDASPPLWERKWTGGDAKGGDEEEDDEMDSESK